MKRSKLYLLVAGLFVMNLGPAEGVIRGDGGDRPNIPVRSMNLKPYQIAANVTITEQDHAGRVGYFDISTGATVTLPRAVGSGAVYRFFTKTLIASGAAKVQVANADDVIQGVLLAKDDGGASTVIAWATAAGSDTISGNGSTTGGLRGDYYEIEDVAVGVFRVSGCINANGTEATPFSSAV